jgi:hypothetical protein
VTHGTRPEGGDSSPVVLEDLAVAEARRRVERARANVERLRGVDLTDFGDLVRAVTWLFRAIGYWEAVACSRGIDPTEIAPELAL